MVLLLRLPRIHYHPLRGYIAIKISKENLPSEHISSTVGRDKRVDKRGEQRYGGIERWRRFTLKQRHLEDDTGKR